MYYCSLLHKDVSEQKSFWNGGGIYISHQAARQTPHSYWQECPDKDALALALIAYCANWPIGKLSQLLLANEKILFFDIHEKRKNRKCFLMHGDIYQTTFDSCCGQNPGAGYLFQHGHYLGKFIRNLTTTCTFH